MPEEIHTLYSGHILSKARKKKRRRGYRKLSSELGIPEKYLEALENDDFSSLPGSTYIRGYLRSYSKKLDLDPEEILAGYDRYLKDQRKKRKRNISKTKRKKNYTSLFVITITTLIIFFIVSFFWNGEDKSGSYERSLDSKASEDELIAERIIETNKSLPEELPEIDNLTPTNRSLNPSSHPSKETEQLLTEDKITHSLELNFIGESWIEIQDKISLLEYRLVTPGSSINLKGEGPFKILIGNSPNVELTFNRQQINLAPITNKETNVSCIVLPKGTCNEFFKSD